MKKIFKEADFLIPNDNDLLLWPVIAVDQYTSQPEYWENIRNTIGGAPSSLNT